MLQQMPRWIVCLAAMVVFTGCSSFQSTSHFEEPEPQPHLSFNAVASADGIEVPQQMFSLVGADALGMSTFGYELAMWDAMHTDLADASDATP